MGGNSWWLRFGFRHIQDDELKWTSLQEIPSNYGVKKDQHTSMCTFFPVLFISNVVNLSLIWLLIFILPDPSIVFKRTAGFVGFFFVLFCLSLHATF